MSFQDDDRDPYRWIDWLLGSLMAVALVVMFALILNRGAILRHL